MKSVFYRGDSTRIIHLTSVACVLITSRHSTYASFIKANAVFTHSSQHQPSSIPRTKFLFHDLGLEQAQTTLVHALLSSSLNSASPSPSSPQNENDELMNFHHNPKFLSRSKRWVVLVDDEEPIRIAVGDYLYESGYQVTACADADALLEMCTGGTPPSSSEAQTANALPAIPDVIVSDVRMPGKDGLELLTLLKTSERLSNVPVILLTAKSMTADRIAGYRAGADAYLPKPFDPEELLAMIDNAIRRRDEMMNEAGKLAVLKGEISDIKTILKRNAESVVEKTNVHLTPTEREVLEFLCKGFGNGEIAEERGVGVITIDRTVQMLYLKTQTRTRTELVRWAIKTGQIARR